MGTKDAGTDDRATRSELAQSGYSLPEGHFDADGNPINTIEESAANEQRLADESRARTAAGQGGVTTATKAAAGAPENKALAGPDANKEAAASDPLDGVDFASPAARSAAQEAGLDATAFKRKRKTSDKGFTAADVERIAASAQADEE